MKPPELRRDMRCSRIVWQRPNTLVSLFNIPKGYAQDCNVAWSADSAFVSLVVTEFGTNVSGQGPFSLQVFCAQTGQRLLVCSEQSHCSRVVPPIVWHPSNRGILLNHYVNDDVRDVHMLML